MSNLRSPLWRTSYQRSFLFVFQTRHSPVVHVGQRAELITHKVGKGRLKFIDEKKTKQNNLLQRLAYTHGWKTEIWLKLLGKHFISYGYICTLFWSAQPNISMYAQSWHYVQGANSGTYFGYEFGWSQALDRILPFEIDGFNGKH